MSHDDASPISLIELQFRRAKTLCKRGVPNSHFKGDKPKSYAQVALKVRPQAVRPLSGGLKPGRKKPYRLMARFSEEERKIVIGKAVSNHLSINGFIRLSVLGASYVSTIDPAKRQLLLGLNRELSRQGNNLNQIAKHMNAGISSPAQGESMLAMLARSLLAAHQAVRNALAEGRREA